MISLFMNLNFYPQISLNIEFYRMKGCVTVTEHNKHCTVKSRFYMKSRIYVKKYDEQIQNLLNNLSQI